MNCSHAPSTAALHSSEGGRRVDTEQGQSCSACGGECPCPQACERREEARRIEQPCGLVALARAALKGKQ